MSTAEAPQSAPPARPPRKTPAKVVVETPWLGPLPPFSPEAEERGEYVLPSHKDLPCEDGAMENTFDLAQSALLKETILPVLQERHPDGRFCVVHDTAFYYRTDRMRRSTAVVPDWAYVPGLSMLLDGEPRPSFLTWQELVRPVVFLEYVSDDEGRERDRTPEEGKFWIYEQILMPSYYGLYDVLPGQLELYRLAAGGFELVGPNAAGRFPLERLGLELGVWTGDNQGVTLPWMRWYRPDGSLLPTGAELAQQERRRADQERQRADGERQRAATLAAKLRALGVDPDHI